MGVTIHYRGRLKSPEERASFCKEAAGLAKSLGWSVTRVSDGLILGPHPECDPLFFVFHPDGAMHGVFADEEWAFCKTQFAPVEVHIAIVRLLKHLKPRFFQELEVVDDGQYWETGDRNRLEHLLGITAAAIGSVAQALSEVSAPPPDSTPEDLLDRIEHAIQQRLWGDR